MLTVDLGVLVTDGQSSSSAAVSHVLSRSAQAEDCGNQNLLDTFTGMVVLDVAVFAPSLLYLFLVFGLNQPPFSLGFSFWSKNSGGNSAL